MSFHVKKHVNCGVMWQCMKWHPCFSYEPFFMLSWFCQSYWTPFWWSMEKICCRAVEHVHALKIARENVIRCASWLQALDEWHTAPGRCGCELLAVQYFTNKTTIPPLHHFRFKYNSFWKKNIHDFILLKNKNFINYKKNKIFHKNFDKIKLNLYNFFFISNNKR